MDRTTITICRINVSLNGLLTAGLNNKELEELESKVIGLIDKATHRRTPKFLQSQSKENKIEKEDVQNNGPEQASVMVSAPGTIEQSTAKIEIDKENNNEIKKRVRWDCNSCINKCDKERGSAGICYLCEGFYEKNEKTNKYYQRKPKDIPDNCSKCQYCKWSEEINKYVCMVNYRIEGENGSYHYPIRNNYLTKNRPVNCKLGL